MISHVDIVMALSYTLAVISAIIVGFIVKLPLLPERPMRYSFTISIIFPTTVIALGLSAMAFELGLNGIMVGIITGVLSALVSRYLLEKILPKPAEQGDLNE
ncbi:MAG: energy-converting hydrogenase A subunit A EhaA [Methanobacteriaceae archaeon]|jgi:energy-converting hydrogenase A subunit A